MEGYQRSKSAVSIDGGGGRSAPAPKNILKRIETHVRLMSHFDNFSISSSLTALRLRRPSAADGGGAEPSQSVDRGVSPVPPSEGWTAPYTATRVHRGTSTAQFYEEVVAPCVANCTSGQSYLFLLTGPNESGRSQTLYGSPHHSERGLVELAAQDLVRRVADRRKLVQQAGQTVPPSAEGPGIDKENTGVVTNNNNNNNTDGDQPVGGMTVTYAAFTTRGDVMVDTVTGEPVRLEEFPPPLGTMALPDVRLLEDPAKAVVLPEKKHLDTSCIIQFYVYAPVDGSGRRSMATLTFIDVAAFRLPFCRELQHLATTVQRVAGVAPAEDSGDAQFKETKLTTLLEPALQGYVTMVSITTISGRPDLHEAACVALQFAQDVSRIHQVLMLIHIQTPKWFFETARQVERLREERGRLMEEHYARGVHDYYLTAKQWLERNICDVDGRLERLLAETEEVRRGIAAEVDAQHQELRTQANQEEVAYQNDAQAASAANSESARRLDERQRLDDTIAQLEQQLTQGELESGHHLSEMRLEVAALEAQAASRGQERQQAEKEATLYQQKAEELQRVLAAYADELNYAQGLYQYAREVELLGRKRSRLEADLQLASQVVQQQSGHVRADRERRSRLSRLTAVQQRVEQLRETTQANTARLTSAYDGKKRSGSGAPQPQRRAGSSRSRSARRKASPSS